MQSSINSPVPSLLMKHLVIGQRLKLIISRLFISHHEVVWFPLSAFGSHEVVHLPKNTETSFMTESDQSGPDH